MKIAGLQKMTLLDFPGKVACTVFLPGCNFRCPFCHNGELLEGDIPAVMDDAELLAFLGRRRGLLDGVCVTGGEPTLQPGLPQLLREIRAMGYAIKLDTNGSRPEVVKALVAEGLVDYVAMDVKNAPDRYGETAGLPGPVPDGVEETLTFLLEGGVDYELRTTVVQQLHDEAAFHAIARWLEELSPRRARRFFLQSFTDRDTVLCPGLTAPPAEAMARYRDILSGCAEQAELRGL